MNPVQTKNNILQINGKSYDSRSGQLLDLSGGQPRPVIDDFVAAAPKVRPQASKPMTHRVKKPAEPQRALPSKHKPGHHPQPTHTLKRTGLNKPAPSLKASRQVHVPLKQVAVRKMNNSDMSLSEIISEKRLIRAQQVNKSPYIKRFVNNPHRTEIAVETRPELPEPITVHELAVPSRPFVAPPVAKRYQQAPKALHHKRPLVTKTRLAGVAVLALIVLGYFGYQKLPTIYVKMASVHSGIQAMMPAYIPSGFSFQGPVQYASGIVSLSFKASGNRTYTITQQASNWDNQTLQQYVASITPNYYSQSNNGLTIYLYNNNDAAWLKNGVRYELSGSGQLSSQQVMAIATSL